VPAHTLISKPAAMPEIDLVVIVHLLEKVPLARARKAFESTPSKDTAYAHLSHLNQARCSPGPLRDLSRPGRVRVPLALKITRAA
jgi:hypothetical protein